jgi:hypothetical protein
MKEAVMMTTKTKDLLNDQRVQEEIRKHLWLESEKAGHDIGFDKAAEDWLKRYSKDWEIQHKTIPAQKNTSQIPSRSGKAIKR